MKIEKITLNPYLKEREKYLPKEENFGVADVRITTQNEEVFNIGIQFIDGCYVQNKLLLYYAQVHTNQLEQKGQPQVARTITINILDFKYFNTEEYHKKIKIQDHPKEGQPEETIELHVIELPKLECQEKLTKEQAWIAYFAGIETKDKWNQFPNIQKLDNLLDQYWKEEKIE